MIRKIRNLLYEAYYRIVSSIAFIPSIISITFFILGILSLWLFDSKLNEILDERVPEIIIDNADTARAILASFIGGIISLTSISFSVVMLLLSQASANFSPRLLPALISDTRNQIVLGFFLGSIIFMVIVFISIVPSDGNSTSSGFSVFLSICFGMLSIGIFVYFVHHMSVSIQIDEILNKVYNDAKDRLEKRLESQQELSPLDTKGWKSIDRKEGGYYQGVNLQGMLKIMDRYEINIKIVPFKGDYTYPNSEVLKVDKDLNNEQKEMIMNNLIFSNSNEASENYVLGIKQITEVGVKAMSPAINDPGTAIVSINYITHLLELRMRLDDHEVYKTDNGKYKIELRILDFETIMYESFAEYRIYCNHDYTVMRKISEMFSYLINREMKMEHYKDVIVTQIELFKNAIDKGIEEDKDRSRLNKYLPNQMRA